MLKSCESESESYKYVGNEFLCFSIPNLRSAQLQVVGRSRPPSLTDKPNLPLIESFIMEIQRLCCIGKYEIHLFLSISSLSTNGKKR